MIEIVGANMYRDGGTTFVFLKENEKAFMVEFDHKLPNNGRKRVITKTESGVRKEYTIGSNEEKEVCLLIKNLLSKQYGDKMVTDYLSNKIENPGEDYWKYVFIFAWLAQKENKFA